MEDPGEEWEIDEYYTSGEEVSQSKISWILSRGLWLGKKVVITGFVISSAPLVIPPLMVVSALGFAVSVPFGVFAASYTCTEKLMSKLLPIPQSYGMLDYGPEVMDEAEEDGSDEEEFAMVEEEKKQIQDTKEEVEGRTVEDGNKEQQKGNIMPVVDPNSLEDSPKVKQDKLYNEEALKEKGYEEDDGEYLEGGDEGSLGGRNVKIEGPSEDSVKESSIKESEDEPQPIVKQVVVVVEQEKIDGKDVKKKCEVVLTRPVQGGTESAVFKSEEAEVKAESIGFLEKVRDEGNSGEPVKKNKKKNKHRMKKSAGGTKEDRSVEDMKGRENNYGETTRETVLDDAEKAEVAAMPVGSQNILISGNLPEEQHNFVVEKVNPIVAKKQASHGQEMDNAAVSNGPEVVPVGSNAIHNESACNEKPSKVEAAVVSNEISPSEKNLWEQINAVRLIVGYKMTHQPSFIEEVKALYVFTGVEPPSSLEDTANIRDAEEKLHFLMSIVGVK